MAEERRALKRDEVKGLATNKISISEMQFKNMDEILLLT